MLQQIEGNIATIKEILAGDKDIRLLLTDNPILTAEDIKNKQLITDYPVILGDDNVPSFISIVHDNSSRLNNTFISTYKISCGVGLDAWRTPDGKIRVYEIAAKIESLLDGEKLNCSTGQFILDTIVSSYWNSVVTGISMVFQTEEVGDINGEIL